MLEGGALGGCQVGLFVVEDLGFRAYVQRIGSAAGKNTVIAPRSCTWLSASTLSATLLCTESTLSPFCSAL